MYIIQCVRIVYKARLPLFFSQNLSRDNVRNADCRSPILMISHMSYINS